MMGSLQMSVSRRIISELQSDFVPLWEIFLHWKHEYIVCFNCSVKYEWVGMSLLVMVTLSETVSVACSRKISLHLYKHRL